MHPSDGQPADKADGCALRLVSEPPGDARVGRAGEVEDHAARCPTWAPPCPDGEPIELRHALGFREREPRRVELRVVLGADDHGTCQVVFREYHSEVRVRVFVHRRSEEVRSDDRDLVDCPVRFWLARRLGWRAVVDHDTDQELPLCIPGDLSDESQPYLTYRAVNRRAAPAAGEPVPLGPIYHYWR